MSRKRHKPRKYIWVAYQKDPPGLPIAVADTCTELAEMVGVSDNTVTSMEQRRRNGEIKKHAIYARVEVDDGTND